MLIMVSGAVSGSTGSNNNQRSTGTAQVTRDTTQIGQIVQAASTVRNFNQTIIDTNNHGGNSVTYRLRLKNSDNAFSKRARMGLVQQMTSSNTEMQGSAVLTVLEVLQ